MNVLRPARGPHVARLVLAFGVMALIGLNANAQSASQLAGIWQIAQPVFALRTLEGKEPPLKPEAAKVYAKRLAARKQGDTSFDSATWCASVGVPRIMLINYPFEIVVRPPYVALLHEWNWWARVVYLEGALADSSGGPAAGPPPQGPPPGPPSGASSGPPGEGPPGGGPPPSSNGPSSMGLSKGRWEGDTLIVETTKLDDSKLLDNAGLPHSAALKVTERLRLRNADVLENKIRIEDSATFTQPWETLVTYRRRNDTTIQEDVCLDRIKTGAPALRE